MEWSLELLRELKSYKIKGGWNIIKRKILKDVFYWKDQRSQLDKSNGLVMSPKWPFAKSFALSLALLGAVRNLINGV